MDSKQAQEILDKIIGQIFGYQNPYTTDQFLQKYAFDVRLPQQVNDATTGQETWSQSVNTTRYITLNNARARVAVDDWMLPARQLNGIEDIMSAWNEVNFMTTERQIDSLNVAESDNIYNSENVYRSQDINESKNIIFTDGVFKCEYLAAGQRSNSSAFCARLEDSRNCSNSFAVSWSNKVQNSFFIEDCFDLYECMFCSHIASKKFCIANIQYDEAEYRRLKEIVVRWVLTA